MGINPPDDDSKQKIVMGYPSMDRYHHTYPQPPPSSAYPPPPPGYASSSFQPSPPPPAGYASSSFHPAPVQGYDPSQFQHDGKYPNPTPPNPYAQPYNDYYYQQQYKPLIIESNKNSSFGRLMLILMIVLVASMCMMSLVMWFLFGTYIPEFEVSSIKISNFTATNTSMTGNWNVNVNVLNTNKDFSITFDRVITSVCYKDALLGISTLPPFHVEKMQRSDLNFSMPVEQASDDQKLHNWVLPTLSQDLDNGILIFGLRFSMKANFTAPNIVYRQESLRVLCENLQINFTSQGEGTLVPGLGNPCLIRLHESIKD